MFVKPIIGPPSIFGFPQSTGINTFELLSLYHVAIHSSFLKIWSSTSTPKEKVLESDNIVATEVVIFVILYCCYYLISVCEMVVNTYLES